MLLSSRHYQKGGGGMSEATKGTVTFYDGIRVDVVLTVEIISNGNSHSTIGRIVNAESSNNFGISLTGKLINLTNHQIFMNPANATFEPCP
jgi:hypothetical protein